MDCYVISALAPVERLPAYPYNAAPIWCPDHSDEMVGACRWYPGMKSSRVTSLLPRPPLWRLLAVQGGLLVVAAVAASLVDPLIGSSLLVGGLLFLLPHAWFGWRVFRHRGAGAAQQVLRGFHRAEAGKFLLTGAGFAMVFMVVRPLHAVAFFGAYIVLYVVNTVLLARHDGFWRQGSTAAGGESEEP